MNHTFKVHIKYKNDLCGPVACSVEKASEKTMRLVPSPGHSVLLRGHMVPEMSRLIILRIPVGWVNQFGTSARPAELADWAEIHRA